MRPCWKSSKSNSDIPRTSAKPQRYASDHDKPCAAAPRSGPQHGIVGIDNRELGHRFLCFAPCVGDARQSGFRPTAGWIEYFTDGPNAGLFAEPLADASRLVVPTVSVDEVFRVVRRRRGEDDALRAAALMSRGREIPLTSTLALEAAHLAHERGLAMADGIILATARLARATLWTQDVDFDGMQHIRYFPKVPA